MPRTKVTSGKPWYSNHKFCVYPLDEPTKTAIEEKLCEAGTVEIIWRIFNYVVPQNKYPGSSRNQKEIHVTNITFDIALFLKDNREKRSFSFVIFRREYNTNPWVIWQEGNKSPSEDASQFYASRRRNA